MDRIAIKCRLHHSTFVMNLRGHILIKDYKTTFASVGYEM